MKISHREVKFGHECSVTENPGRHPGIFVAKPRGTIDDNLAKHLTVEREEPLNGRPRPNISREEPLM
ncbi:hypothetical protein Syun_023131 [Stephania yunnanensis]|uniref:Uncharacterized protein n=1 Tax=Stephania yunnanensis TaxID=152371 RepID=A0AAP0FAW1_9MAGN